MAVSEVRTVAAQLLILSGSAGAVSLTSTGFALRKEMS